MAVKTQRGRLIQKIPSRLNQRDLVLWQGKRGKGGVGKGGS